MKTYTIWILGALHGLCELPGGVPWVVLVVDDGLVKILRCDRISGPFYHFKFGATTNFTSAVVDVHDLSDGAPALAGTLLEDTNGILVATVPTNATVGIDFSSGWKTATHKLLTWDSTQAVWSTSSVINRLDY